MQVDLEDPKEFRVFVLLFGKVLLENVIGLY